MACVYERANRMKKTIFANFNGLHVHVKTATVTKTATMQQTANICKNFAKKCTCLLDIGKFSMVLQVLGRAWSCFTITHNFIYTNAELDRGSIKSSLRYGLSPSYRLTKEQCWTVLDYHVLIYIGYLQYVCFPALNLSYLST